MKNSKFKTIIVGVDFSDYSKIVAKQAIKLAELYDAKLIFIHAISSALYTTDVRLYYDITNDVVEPMKEEVFAFYNLEKLETQPQVIATISTPTALITSVAEKTRDPLIVVGHRGQSKLGRFFLGSTAESLALSANAPVWIHRGDAVRIPRRVLLPSDYSLRSKSSLKAVESLANGKKPALEFYHVHGAPKAVMDINLYQKLLNAYNASEREKQKRFRSVFPSVPLKEETGDVVDSIVSESKKFDLIAMAPHNRKGLFSKFGSVTGKIVRTGNTPILITR
jgi:nucleotide-binding universal stress UspA family protein